MKLEAKQRLTATKALKFDMINTALDRLITQVKKIKPLKISKEEKSADELSTSRPALKQIGQELTQLAQKVEEARGLVYDTER